jgi:putative PIN family toxin of toxin-antitoxin system
MAGILLDKVVFDTSNIISFILAKNIDYIVDLKFRYNIETYTCSQHLSEISKVLAYKKFNKQLVLKPSEYINFLEKYCNVIEVDERFDRVPDPKDNYLIDLAHTAKSHYLVSRDPHLLNLKQIRWGKIQIVGITEFKRLVAAKK